MVLVAGNFLNTGGYAGNAAGMKMSSLHKLSDTRSNKPGLNLLHYVASNCEETNPELLTLPEDLAILDEASRTSIEQLKADIGKLNGEINKIQNQMKNPNTKADVKGQMREFLPKASSDVERLQEALASLEEMQKEVAEYFCEDVATFKMDEFCRLLHSFFVKFKKVVTWQLRGRHNMLILLLPFSGN